MAIIFRGANTSVLSASGASITPVVPASVQAGDLLLIFVGCGNAAITYTSTTGGTWLSTTATSGSAYSQQLLYRYATATDANSTITVTGSANHLHGGILLAYGNVGAFDPAPAAGAETSSVLTTASAPSISPANPGDTLVWFGATSQVSATGAPTIAIPTSPGTWSREGTATTSSGPGSATDYITFAFADTIFATSGATGAVTGAIGNTTPVTTGGQMVSLQPAASGAPDRALPGPSFRGQFSKTSAKAQPSVLYDTYLQFSGAYSSAGDIAFAAVTLGGVQIFGPPHRSIFSPAWRGQFSKYSTEEQPAVLYDVWLQFSGSYLTAGDIAFGAITIGSAQLFGPPQRALFSPAWRGQFSKYSSEEQPAVLYDAPPSSSSVSASINASPAAFVATFTQPNVTATSGMDIYAAEPGPAWRNQFGHLTKYAVYYDGHEDAFVSANPAAFIATFTDQGNLTVSGGASLTATTAAFIATLSTPAILATSGMDIYAAATSPAWRNQFGHLTKYPVLYDGHEDAFVSAVPAAFIATFTDQGSLTVNAGAGPTPAVLAALATFTTPSILATSGMDVYAAAPGPAWQNQFGHLTKHAVYHDGHEDALVSAVPAQFIATFTDQGNLTVSGGASVTTTTAAFIATFTTPATLATSGMDIYAANPGEAWRNSFGHLTKYAVLYDGHLDAYVSANPAQFIATFTDQGNLTVNAGAGITATPLAGIAAFIDQAQLSILATSGMDPYAAAPGPAWRNQFGHLTKFAVPYDILATGPVSASVTATPFAALATFTTPQVTATSGMDPYQVTPGPAWLNTFGLTFAQKHPVLYDGHLDAYVSAVPAQFEATFIDQGSVTASGGAGAGGGTLGGLTTFTLPTITATSGMDLYAAEPGPAWENQFGHLTKHAVLYDGHEDAFVSAVPLAAQASFTDQSQIAVFTSVGMDPYAAEPGPAWRNQFGHLIKYAVLLDGHEDAFVLAVPLQAIATFTDQGNLTVNAGAGIAPTPLAALAVFSTVTVFALISNADPAGISTSPAWRNQFGHHMSKEAVLSDRTKPPFQPGSSKNNLLMASMP